MNKKILSLGMLFAFASTVNAQNNNFKFEAPQFPGANQEYKAWKEAQKVNAAKAERLELERINKEAAKAAKAASQIDNARLAEKLASKAKAEELASKAKKKALFDNVSKFNEAMAKDAKREVQLNENNINQKTYEKNFGSSGEIGKKDLRSSMNGVQNNKVATGKTPKFGRFAQFSNRMPKRFAGLLAVPAVALIGGYFGLASMKNEKKEASIEKVEKIEAEKVEKIEASTEKVEKYEIIKKLPEEINNAVYRINGEQTPEEILKAVTPEAVTPSFLDKIPGGKYTVAAVGVTGLAVAGYYAYNYFYGEDELA